MKYLKLFENFNSDDEDLISIKNNLEKHYGDKI